MVTSKRFQGAKGFKDYALRFRALDLGLSGLRSLQRDSIKRWGFPKLVFFWVEGSLKYGVKYFRVYVGVPTYRGRVQGLGHIGVMGIFIYFWGPGKDP